MTRIEVGFQMRIGEDMGNSVWVTFVTDSIYGYFPLKGSVYVEIWYFILLCHLT